jgi:ring-1,2-phenylacetyl-CoA epoxidase subunit PaaE
MLSILRTLLARDAFAKFTLIYANQRTSSAMFLEELHDLKDAHSERLSLIHIFSRQQSDAPLFHGRLDEAKLRELLPAAVPLSRIDQVLVCGPEALIETVERVLPQLGIAADRVHSERFLSVAPKNIATNVLGTPAIPVKNQKNGISVPLKLTLDGKTHDLQLAADQTILDAALDAGLDLPYSCKGGVCCTCRAMCTSGSVHMDKCFTLEKDEIQAGFILTCQAKATSEAVAVDFDRR